jgi:hypothetical protein
MAFMRTFKQFLFEALKFSTEDISKEGKAKGRYELVQAAGISAETMKKMKPYFKNATASTLEKDYNAFVTAFSKEAKAINDQKPDGVGPGELVVYFVFDNIGIGGKNASIDIYMDGKPFAEAKGGVYRAMDNVVNGFKITKDGDKAVQQLLKDLDAFNEKHHEITGEDLPWWRDAGTAVTTSVRGWRDINLKTLAKDNTGGSKKPINLILKKDGDLLQKGDSEPILNVKTNKTTEPIVKLIDGSGGNIAIDDDINTLDQIEKRWAEQAYKDYVGGKKFVLLNSKTMKMLFFGELTKDMIGLDYTNRNQPYAAIKLSSKSK